MKATILAILACIVFADHAYAQEPSSRLTDQLTWKAMNGLSFVQPLKDPGKEPEFNQLLGLWAYAAAGKPIPQDILDDLITRANRPKLKFSLLDANGYRWEMRHVILAEYDQSQDLKRLTTMADQQQQHLEEQAETIKALESRLAFAAATMRQLEDRINKVQEENQKFKEGLLDLIRKNGNDK